MKMINYLSLAIFAMVAGSLAGAVITVIDLLLG
jgi:hypothetical protein